MRLYLVQHGEALSADDDPARPLSEAGRRDVTSLARFLKTRGLEIARVVHSGKRRAEETAAILASALAPHAPIERQDGLAPNDSVADFARRVETWHVEHLVVGHLPFMDRAVAHLITGSHSTGVPPFARARSPAWNGTGNPGASPGCFGRSSWGPADSSGPV